MGEKAGTVAYAHSFQEVELLNCCVESFEFHVLTTN